MARKKAKSRPPAPKYLPPSPLQSIPPHDAPGGAAPAMEEQPNVVASGALKEHFQKRKSWMEATIFHSPYRGIFNLVAVWVTWTIILNHFQKQPAPYLLLSLSQWEYVWKIADLFHCWIHLVVMFPGITYLLHLTKYYVITSRSHPSTNYKIPTKFLDFSFGTWMVLCVWMTSYLIWKEKAGWFPPQKMFYLTSVLLFLMKMISFWMLEAHPLHPPSPGPGGRVEGVVGIGHYVRFLLAPTLVFARDYPSRKKIRRKYLMKKGMGMLIVWGLVHVMVGDYILPAMRAAPSKSVLGTVSDMMVPVMMVQWLLFYLVFEILLNAFAEFSSFADREFYNDWWNSGNFGEFARKWNKPVHVWLYLHIYNPSLRSWNNKTLATLLTFLVSAVFHEWFIALVSGKLVFWLFWLQMFQLPLTAVIKSLHHVIPAQWNRVVENLIFWSCLLIGSPLLLCLYSLHIYAP